MRASLLAGQLCRCRRKRDEGGANLEYTEWLKNHRDDVLRGYAWLKRKLANDILVHHGVKGQKWGVRNGPPYPLSRSNNNGLKNAGGQRIIKVAHTSLSGQPNTVTQVTNRNGGIDRNYYGADGKQTKQISNNDHGHPKAHNYGEHGEHAHDYIYDDSGELIDRPIRELNSQERKENGDIL